MEGCESQEKWSDFSATGTMTVSAAGDELIIGSGRRLSVLKFAGSLDPDIKITATEASHAMGSINHRFAHLA